MVIGKMTKKLLPKQVTIHFSIPKDIEGKDHRVQKSNPKENQGPICKANVIPTYI